MSILVGLLLYELAEWLLRMGLQHMKQNAKPMPLVDEVHALSREALAAEGIRILATITDPRDAFIVMRLIHLADPRWTTKEKK